MFWAQLQGTGNLIVAEQLRQERSLTIAVDGLGAVELVRSLSEQPTEPLPSLEQVREFVPVSKAENTIRGYQSDWRQFSQWCQEHGLAPLLATPETVAAYIAACAGHLKVGSIQRRLNAIAEAHKATGMESLPIPESSGTP